MHTFRYVGRQVTCMSLHRCFDSPFHCFCVQELMLEPLALQGLARLQGLQMCLQCLKMQLCLPWRLQRILSHGMQLCCGVHHRATSAGQ